MLPDMATDNAQDLLGDAFGRIRELVQSVTDGLDLAAATYRPDPESNTVAWLVWHLTRIQDDHVADLADTRQVWEAWRDRFGLPFDAVATGYGHSSQEVAAVRVEARLLSAYHSDVHGATLSYLDRLSAAELDRVVDASWDPPVTVVVRLVSVICDALQHVGQAAYVRGVAERTRAGD